MRLMITPEGDTVSMYSDTLPIERLGVPDIQRASNIAFNNCRQQFEATLVSGELIATGRKYADVVAKEIEVIESRLGK